MDSPTPIMFTNPDVFYTRNFKMGVEKEKRGRVGFARILCVSTQVDGSATEKQRDHSRPFTVQKRHAKW